MIDSDTQKLLIEIAKRTKFTSTVARMISATQTQMVVDSGGGPFTASVASDYLPEVNDTVIVWSFDGVHFVVGSAVMKPGQGTVVSVSGNFVTLDTVFGQVTVPFMRGITPAVSDVWMLSWNGGGKAVIPLSTSPVPGVPPPVTDGGAVQHVDTFTAVDAGSYGYGSWKRGQVISSDHWQGAWFYGSKISDTLPSSAVVTKVELYLSVAQIIVNANTNIALHGYQSMPGGAPSYGTSVSVPPISGWVTLPNSFGSALQTGGGSAGVGTNTGGWTNFSSLSQDGQSGTIRISSKY
ncbi:hypothetical protein KPL76_06150 [Subtercola sp. PAMC28395]|uniref:hypothetical protein n=1 Tax=Subtercola sp. PAMC28395 TaxID=2846775 RepID=UPI001C0DF0EE|nr:hypothetical protein [Subtercola sp. PAMC28395]QWT24935.1 hypothetical protein KPL76_06150 [Subtercola sp. PAMC28395]